MKVFAVILAMSLAFHYAPDAEGSKTHKETKKVVQDTKHTESKNVKVDYFPKLKKLGYEDKIARLIISECQKAKDAGKCIKYAGAIGKNESSAGKAVNHRNSVFGVAESYKTKEDSVKAFIAKYNKYWYKADGVHFFYSNKAGMKPRSRYCTDEVQPNGKLLPYCPNGFKNTTNALAILKK